MVHYDLDDGCMRGCKGDKLCEARCPQAAAAKAAKKPPAKKPPAKEPDTQLNIPNIGSEQEVAKELNEYGLQLIGGILTGAQTEDRRIIDKDKEALIEIYGEGIRPYVDTVDGLQSLMTRYVSSLGDSGIGIPGSEGLVIVGGPEKLNIPIGFLAKLGTVGVSSVYHHTRDLVRTLYGDEYEEILDYADFISGSGIVRSGVIGGFHDFTKVLGHLGVHDLT